MGASVSRLLHKRASFNAFIPFVCCLSLALGKTSSLERRPHWLLTTVHRVGVFII